MALNVIMLGPPGAGKGTQAARLARERCLPKISTGDILREAVQTGSELGRVARAAMDAGRLVSDDVMIGIVRDRLERADAVGGFVLDGFPRTVAQARALDVIMVGRNPLIVIEIAVPDDELVKRLRTRRICGKCGAGVDPTWIGTVCAKCGGLLVQRADDGEAIVRERLRVYAQETGPIVDYYRARPTYRLIDGNQPADRVAEAIRAAVEASAAGAGAAARGDVVDRGL
jgi:adenylate kinase